MQKTIKLIKLAQSDINNRYPIGFEITGEFISVPVIGDAFWVGYGYRTATVHEIMDNQTFRTLDGTYKYLFI